jgi:hypothetical protein
VFGALLLVVLHLQTVTKTLIPGFYILGADTANVVLMAIALVAALYRSLQLRWPTEARSRGLRQVDHCGFACSG